MWIELHDNLPDNPKVLKLANMMNLPDTQVVGMLACLWTWALSNRPDGILTEYDWRAVERAARWTGEDKAFFDALVTIGFIDATSTGAALHNWKHYAGKLIERREKDRARKAVEKAKESCRNSDDAPHCFHRNSTGMQSDFRKGSSRVPGATIPNLTVPLVDDDVKRAQRDEFNQNSDEESMDSEILTMPHTENEIRAYQYIRKICTATPRTHETISSFLNNGLEDELICEAIDLAVENGIHKWAYLNKILSNCVRQGITTHLEFKTLQVEYKNTNTVAKPRAAPGASSSSLKDFSERDYAGQRNYQQEDFARLKSSIDDL